MLNQLLTLDYQLSYIIFSLPHPWLLQIFFEFISAVGNYGVLWLILLIYIIVVEQKKNHRFIFIFLFSIMFAATLNEFILKNIFMRLRPSYLILTDFNPSALLRTSRLQLIATDYSFPSSHAVFAFCAAYILTFFDKKRINLFYILALLVTFSRVYLGYHYILDVIAGSIVGYLIAYFIIKLKR